MSVGLLLTVWLSQSAQTDATPPQAFRQDAASEHRGFRFSSGSCELGPDFCAVSVPKEWIPSETDLIRGALDEIVADPLGARILERALSNGYRTLRRFSRAARQNLEAGSYEALPLIVATAHSDSRIKSIDVNDRFFHRMDARDAFSGAPGYRLTTEILLHELVHAIDDDRQYSNRNEFRRLLRLRVTPAEQREKNRVGAEVNQLVEAGKYGAAWQLGRAHATTVSTRRLPSLRAMESTREAFAEIGAHLVLDPNARKRLAPAIVAYFERALVNP